LALWSLALWQLKENKGPRGFFADLFGNAARPQRAVPT
jgi:hypothetical protein